MTQTDQTSPVSSNDVNCRFYDGAAGKNTHSNCGGLATGFLRIKHSGRLCPLCDPCKATFIAAKEGMKEEVKKGFPGECSFEDVTIADGRDEFLKQAPKKAF